MAKVGHTCVDLLFSRNDISHVEVLQPYISSCSEAMSEWINPCKFLNRPPRGKVPLYIEPHSASFQLSSPLFSKLSGELRSLIYSFVFPPQTVHVHLKACRVNDRWTRAHISQQECWPLDGDEVATATPETYESRSFMKTTCHACSFPHDWERQYALSNHPEAIPQQYLNKNGRPSLYRGPCPEAIRPPFELHGLCPVGPEKQNDIGEFKCENVRLEVSLLQTCRRIYLETWFLPFDNFTFQFMSPYPGVPKDFTTAMLYEHQARAIERVHVHNLQYWSDYGGVEGLFHHFPGLKHLRVLLEGCKEDWEKVCKPANLRSVEVVVGIDYGPSPATRLVRRKRAVAAERILLGEQAWQRRQLVDAGREQGDCFALERNVLIAPKDRTKYWTV